MGPTPKVRKTALLRHRWSHRSPVHRALVRVANRCLRWVPGRLKYRFGMALRREHYPYCLVRPGSTCVQIGAPADTLRSGRSRGMYFSLFAGDTGTVVIIEPDSTSQRAFAQYARKLGTSNIRFQACGAWSERGVLSLYVDDAHPATNFTAGTADYDAPDLLRFREIPVDVDTVDNILQEQGVDSVDLVSITTNGSERMIVDGLQETIARRGLQFISLAGTGPGLVELMDENGFELLTRDDRGFTFQRRE